MFLTVRQPAARKKCHLWAPAGGGSPPLRLTVTFYSHFSWNRRKRVLHPIFADKSLFRRDGKPVPYLKTEHNSLYFNVSAYIQYHVVFYSPFFCKPHYRRKTPQGVFSVCIPVCRSVVCPANNAVCFSFSFSARFPARFCPFPRSFCY